MIDVALTADAVVCVRDYADLHFAMRERVRELGVSMELIDELSGVAKGYSAKILSPNLGEPNRRGRPKGRRVGWETMPHFLPALGLRLLVAKDPDATARLQHRWTKKNARFAKSTPLGPSPAERAGDLRRAQCRLAGKARMKQMSKPERTEFGRRGGEARRDALTSWRRRKSARNAAIARWSAQMRASELARITEQGIAA